MVASTSKQASEDRLQPSNASNSGSDSEDDDFVPEETGEPSGSVANTSTVPKKPSKTTNAGSDIDSDAAESDDDEGKTAAQGDGIDDEELDALKRERAELVAAAGGEDRLGKRRRLAPAANTDAVDSGVVDSEAEALKAKALAEWEAIKGSDSAPTATDLPTSASSQHAPTSSSASPAQEDLIAVPTTYKFAGEVHTTTRMLPRSHPDAVKHLSQAPSAPAKAASSTTTPASASTAARPPPGPRRKKGSSLAALSAAATAKPAKLNTLEKSKLDWDSFKGDAAKLSQHERDELEHQTRGGGKGLGDMKGYLERRDFLDRVKDRTGQP